MKWPRLSLIMPSFNQETFLEEAICSVLEQDYPNLEFMILDGGSTDGSKAIIEKYGAHLTYWYSHTDAGQSAAIDHGLSRATGELSGWLNSDDLLLPGTLQYIAESYLANPTGGLFSGNLIFIDQRGIITGFLRMPSQAAWFTRLGIYTVSQPGSFFKTSAYHQSGGVRHDLHFVMDNELYMRLLLQGVKHVYLDRYLAAFRRHSDQKTTFFRGKTKAESRQLDQEFRRQGRTYQSAVPLTLYYAWQAINGNYLRKRLHTLIASGLHWRFWIQQNEFKS